MLIIRLAFLACLLGGLGLFWVSAVAYPRWELIEEEE